MDKAQYSIYPTPSSKGCTECVCRNCLYWWSGRCPHGECYDDLRAVVMPYDKAHPNEPPRTAWTKWRTEQAYWCRGGITYPAHGCDSYYPNGNAQVFTCLNANVTRFSDGYIRCSIIESVGCAECYKRFLDKAERMN